MVSTMSLEEDRYHESINVRDERWECEIANIHAYLY